MTYGAGISTRSGTMRQDLRYAMRMLLKRPLFSLVAILTLAIGIGANTAIFSVINSVLLQPLPYPESDRLTVIWSTFGKEGRAPASGPELTSLQQRSRLFDQFAGIWVKTGALTKDGEPEQVKLGWVTSNFLSLLSARPEVGRFFLPSEQGIGTAPAVVLSYNLWQRRYAGSPSVVGRSVLLSGQSCTVVGILPADFKLLFPEGSGVPSDVDVYVPFQWDLASQPRNAAYIRIIGRLRNGVTVQQGQSELTSIATQLRSEFLEYSGENLQLQALSLRGDVARNARPALLALFAGTGFVLLIVCANLAMLLLSRANERRAEITVRAALGAQPKRIIRQLLTESVVMSCLGGIAALAVSWGLLKALWALEPQGIARTTSSGLSLPVLGFNFAVSLVCGVLFGLSPALEARRVNLANVLREATKSTAGERHLPRQVLIGCEVALTFVLLTSSALLISTFIDILRVQPGFDSHDVITFHLSLPNVRYGNSSMADQFFRELQRKISTLPGVRAVGVVSHLPFDDTVPNWYSYYSRYDAPQDQQHELMADYRGVSPGFFDSLGVSFVAGRNFNTSDDVAKRKVVIIDDSLAKRVWPHEDGIGKKLNVENGDFAQDVAEVVGVVKHVQYHSLTNQVRPQVYWLYALAARADMFVTVRAQSSPELLMPLIREQVASLDRDLPLSNVRLMDDYVSDARTAARFVTVLSGSLAGIALLLSCVGIYGVTSSTVTQRTKEIGIRIAMGAQKQNILMMVLPGSMAPVFLGGLLGVALSFVLTPLLSSLLYGIHPVEPSVLMSVWVGLCVIGLVASFLPTHRVIRSNPIAALRWE